VVWCGVVVVVVVVVVIIVIIVGWYYRRLKIGVGVDGVVVVWSWWKEIVRCKSLVHVPSVGKQTGLGLDSTDLLSTPTEQAQSSPASASSLSHANHTHQSTYLHMRLSPPPTTCSLSRSSLSLSSPTPPLPPPPPQLSTCGNSCLATVDRWNRCEQALAHDMCPQRA
jgi:hypothetical protein